MSLILFVPLPDGKVAQARQKHPILFQIARYFHILQMYGSVKIRMTFLRFEDIDIYVKIKSFSFVFSDVVASVQIFLLCK